MSCAIHASSIKSDSSGVLFPHVHLMSIDCNGIYLCFSGYNIHARPSVVACILRSAMLSIDSKLNSSVNVEYLSCIWSTAQMRLMANISVFGPIAFLLAKPMVTCSSVLLMTYPVQMA